MAEGLGSGVSRRRVLQGTAWSVPVVLIATAVPARATSLPEADGITFSTFQPQWTQWFWDASAGENITAVTVAAYLVNMKTDEQADPGAIHTFFYQVSAPVGTLGSPPDTTMPRWGLGSNSQGIAAGTGFVPDGEPTLANGMFTLRFKWAGDPPMPGHDGEYVMVWVQSNIPAPGPVALGAAQAHHVEANTSQDSDYADTAYIYDVADWLRYFKEYHGLPPIPADDPDDPDEPEDP